MTGFPYRKYSKQELLEEYEKLRMYYPDNTLRRKNTGYKCSNAFFQYERMNTASRRHLNNIDFWEKNKKLIIQYRKSLTLKYRNQDLFGIIQFLNHPPAQFPPNIAIDLYDKFKATKVLDPFSGWGDRCVAAMAKDIDYTGIDSNRNLKPYYEAMIQCYPHDSEIRFIDKPTEKVDLSRIDFNFVLTSPPFWDEELVLTEQYSGMPQDEYEAFMEDVFIPTVLTCARKATWSCYYIPKHMAKYVSTRTGLKWDKVMSYYYSGNKKYQKFSVYCMKRLT